MPVSATKNNQSSEDLNCLVNKAFPKEKIKEIIELTEGFFNIAYSIEFESGLEVILKIAPDPSIDVMTNEKDIMKCEVETMELVRKRKSIKIPKVLFFDFSKKICNSNYFFMEKIPGSSFFSQWGVMSQNEKDKINEEVGKLNKVINEITNDKFGYYAQNEKQGKEWFYVFESMLKDIYNDAEKKNISMPFSKEEIIELLYKEKEIFRDVNIPCLIHWDLWAGNVFVKDGEITGFIDFERCLWADVLMETGFRKCFYEPAFIKGYGLDLTEAEKRRILWYDVYLAGIFCLECDYRGYDNRDNYNMGISIFENTIKEIKN